DGNSAHQVAILIPHCRCDRVARADRVCGSWRGKCDGGRYRRHDTALGALSGWDLVGTQDPVVRVLGPQSSNVLLGECVGVARQAFQPRVGLDEEAWTSGEGLVPRVNLLATVVGQVNG